MKEIRLVALGDSLTYGYGVLSHIAFPSRLAAELPEKRPEIDWKVYNRGINGETTREAKLRLDGGVLRLKPHICTILLGSNDSALNEGQYRTPWEYEKNLRTVQARGPKIVVFTLGDKGSVVVWGEDGYYFAPGYKVEVVDTLGAGDVYHGGFIFAMMQGKRPDECAQFANAVSAIKCTGIGGRAATPTLKMVEDFMATGKYDRSIIEEKTKLYETFNA